MGNGCAKLTLCFSGGPRQIRRRHVAPAALPSDPCDEGFGHSFCYLRPEPPCAAAVAAAAAAVVVEEETTTFRSISGAAISANAATPLSTSLFLLPPASSSSDSGGGGGAFESTDSFASVPLQPVPRFSSGPLSGPIAGDRGFLSGPIERGFLSGPLDPRASSPPSSSSSSTLLRRSLSHTIRLPRRRRRRRRGSRPRPLASAASILRGLSNAIISRAVPSSSSAVAPKLSESASPDPQTLTLNVPLQWAQGKAGEDRVHVVVSESQDDAPSAAHSAAGGGWVFVGIYDGFNGPDATDYLLSHLYPAVHRELRGLLWDDDDDDGGGGQRPPVNARRPRRASRDLSRPSDPSRRPITSSHVEVLKALSKALKKTEDEYLDTADKMLDENPELALMGSCVLVMVMKGEDVYLMNVGDSRAILASQSEHGSRRSAGKAGPGLEQINEEFLDDLGGYLQSLSARQLTLDHSTCVEEEVRRIRNEHPDDSSAIVNDRVKGSLKVTRAFGAGFLKQPKWNNALLEMFQIDYVGTSPYITCNPSLYHYKLGPNDRFLILSSDGLYQYFTNEEAVAQVEMFIAVTPEGDPAQHLVEEVLFRAANKAGMEFHELLEIPQGDRRRYHDDVSIIVISLEGRIWRSCV